jgi:glycosyltransferase involved in cell wall biosynthesis
MPITLAYLAIPHTGGTYSVFESLKEGLKGYGIEVQWLGVGKRHARVLSDPEWFEHCRFGTVAAPDAENDLDIAAGLTEHLSKGSYAGVFVNVLADPICTNAIRYLPANLLRIVIVHSITPGTYAAASAVRQSVHATVGVSPRIAQDLIRRCSFPADSTVSIPNAVDVEHFLGFERERSPNRLRVVCLGRVEDSAKGVFWLPKVMQRLADLPCSLTVVGDGPDLNRLRHLSESLGSRVVFAGPVPRSSVPGILSQHDIYLFPSRYEGLGISLVEAMAAGCVPVASRISGVTEFVVEHGKTGFLFPVGDVNAAAGFIRELALAPQLLAEMAVAGQRAATCRFSLKEMAHEYATLIRHIQQCPPDIAKPLPLERWRYPRGLRPGMRTYLPLSVKNILRQTRERLRRPSPLK